MSGIADRSVSEARVRTVWRRYHAGRRPDKSERVRKNADSERPGFISFGRGPQRRDQSRDGRRRRFIVSGAAGA